MSLPFCVSCKISKIFVVMEGKVTNGVCYKKGTRDIRCAVHFKEVMLDVSGMALTLIPNR